MAAQYVVRRRMSGYVHQQVVDPTGWRHFKLLRQNGWIEPHDGPVYRADDGTRWATEAAAERRSSRAPVSTGEPQPYEFTSAAEAVILGAGYELDDYDGPATGATGNVLKSDAESWAEALNT